jgi:hypothetical protein
LCHRYFHSSVPFSVAPLPAQIAVEVPAFHIVVAAAGLAFPSAAFVAAVPAFHIAVVAEEHCFAGHYFCSSCFHFVFCPGYCFHLFAEQGLHLLKAFCFL